MEYAILALILFALSDKKKVAPAVDTRPVYGPEYKSMETQWSEYSNPNQKTARRYVAEGEWDSDRGMS